MVKQNIAVFGLGSMGFGIAHTLITAGHQVWGYDISDTAMSRFAEAGGSIAEFSTIASELDAVVLVVLNAEQAETLICESPGICHLLQPEALVMNCTTISPGDARRMAEVCAREQLHYLDAPISGGAQKAHTGQLSVMAAGSQQAFGRAQPLLDDMAEKIFEIGDEAGAGSAMKAVNQLLAGVHIATMAEAMGFALAQGIEPQKCVDVISQSAGNSWMFENRAPHIVAADYSPRSAVNIWPKDLGIVMEIANEQGFSAPMTQKALQQFIATRDLGYGLEDDAAIIKLYAEQNSLSLPEPDASPDA